MYLQISVLYFVLFAWRTVFNTSWWAGNEFCHYLCLWERLYFTFIKKKRYFHWIWNPGLTLFLFFGTLKILFLFLLACMVSKEKSAIVFLSLHLSCLFSSDFLQEFVFCFSSLNMILIQVCAGSLFLFLEGIELSFFLLVFLWTSWIWRVSLILENK